ncbi:ERF family protein [Epibacterium ulvae]|uniref:ERF family protein n=1 Tax=Epibacterium ulvae TaxID=1156985 RepID=UPI0024916523|nr:ERF family protein [Epibacterium ulvae]
MNEVTKIQPVDSAQVAPPVANPMISMIERVMLNPEADMDKLDRLLEMQERVEAKNARIAFSGSIANARAEIPPIVKDATVDFTSSKGRTHYKHETLAGIAKIIDPILSKYGLSYRFRTEQGQRGVQVTCIVAHADGHQEETSLSGTPDNSGNKNGFQAVGSAVTYLQRYTLKAALGLSAEVDDDAQNAAPRHNQQQASKPKKQQRSPQQQAHDVCQQMIDGIRNHGAKSVEADPTFPPALDRLRESFPELAANVEAELETWHKANTPASNLVDDDEIPY